jgi:probable rRNA maturation factor
MCRDSAEILISDQQGHVELDPQRVGDVVRHVLAEEELGRARLSMTIIDDAGIRGLNRQFLSHDYPTDVLSFPLSEDEDDLVGEVVISAETARRVADEHGTSAEAELLLYVVHGVLHLAGYDDAASADAQRMHEREEAILARFGHEHAYWRTRAQRG